MSPNEPGGAIPGWDDGSLLDTGQRFRGDGADAGLPEVVRFRTNVARLIRRRMAYVSTTGDPSIFFLLPGGPAEAPSAVSVPMLNNGITAVEGRLWFVGPVAAGGLGLPVDEWDDQAIFGRAMAMGAGEAPAILYETRTEPPEARYFPNGVANQDSYELLRLDSANVTLNEILEVVNRMYERSLRTPDAQHSEAQLWEDKRRWWPYEHAEARIALTLREGLTGAFPTCTVRDEQPQPSGRLDLELFEPLPHDPSQVIYHAILELKVLRSFRSSGTTVAPSVTVSSVAEGVRQAASYRNDRSARASALCCFDMRTTFSGDACFDAVRKLASRHRVTLRVWHIFASSRAWRVHSVDAV
jgi:hypothetical protein